MSRFPGLLRRPLLGTLALALAVTLGAAPLAAPAAAGPTLEQGTPLPWRYETTLRYFSLAGAAPGYLMHSRTQWDENHGPAYSVVRVSDGAVVTTFDQPSTIADGQDPRLVDHAYVEMTRKQGTSYGPDHLDIHDVETGTTTTIDLSAHGGYLHGDDEWALVTDAGATSSERVLSFLRADGDPVAVPSLTAGTDVTWVGGDSTTAYVTTNGRSYALDPQTGSATELTLPGGGPLHLWAVTADTLVGREDAYVNGTSGDRFTTVSRSTGQVLAQTDVADDSRIRGFLPYGERVAALYLPDSGVTTLPEGGTIYRYDLRPLDMGTGALQEPVATNLVDADAMGDGRVALTVGDVPTGRLAVAADDGNEPVPVANLPQIGYGSLAVGLSDGTAVTSFEGQNGLWATAEDGTGEWQPTYPESTPADDRQRDFSVGGDTVLTQLPKAHTWDPDQFRVAWPGDHRDVDTTGTRALSRNGKYVVRSVPGSSYLAEVQDARTGEVVTSWTDPNKKWHLDGDWLWTGPAADGTMTAVDLTGQQPDRTAQVPATCNGKVPELGPVRGRFALARCTGWTLVDLWGVLPPWEVPTTGYEIALGDGFVAWLDVSSDYTVSSLRVADLTTEHTTRAYGPLRGRTYPPGADFAVDTADRPDLLYVDTSNRVRHVHLDWLGQPPLTRPDTTAPVVTAAPTLTPAVRSSDPVTVAPAWTYQEPDVPHEPQSGLAGDDVRWQPYPGGGDTWTQPAAWSGQPSAAVTVTLQPGEGRCFESRAHDVAGNTSAWSEPVCSYVDGAAPVLQPATGTRRFVPEVIAPVSYRYGAQDDYGVASYDVAVRTARRGEPLGAWKTRWSHTTDTGVTVQARPGTERCFRFRARDVAGNPSAWSPARCSVLPVDDSEFATQGDVSLQTNDIAIVGTYTELDHRGASATLRQQTGRTVGLWAITGPYAGKVDLYAGGRHLGRVSLASRWQRRTLITLTSKQRWTGAVRVVSATNRPARIDAIGVQR